MSLRAARLAQYSPLMSAAAVRETAVACTVVAHHWATRLDILSAAAGAPAELARAAFAARHAQEAWLDAARPLMPFSSGSPAALAARGRRMPSALHARDLAQRTGRSRTPTQRGRSPRARLAASNGVPRPGGRNPPIRLLPWSAPCVMPPARRPQAAHDRAAGSRNGARAGKCVMMGGCRRKLSSTLISRARRGSIDYVLGGRIITRPTGRWPRRCWPGRQAYGRR